MRDSNAQVTFDDIRKLARRWWWLLLLCPLLAAGTAYALSAAQTPIYRSSIILLVQQSDTAPGSVGYNNILASEHLTQTYSQLVRSREVIGETIQRLGLPLTPEQLIARTAAAPIQNTQLLRVTVSDESPVNAAIIANTIGQVFIDQLRAQQMAITGTSRDELQRNADSVKRQIDDTSNRIAEISKSADATSPENQATLRSLQSLLSQYRTTYATLLEAQQSAAIQESAAGTRVRVAEQAVPPKSFASPRIMLNTVVAGILGLLIAVGLVALAGHLDDTVKNPDDVRRVGDYPTLGSIPALRGADGLEPLLHPRSAATEGYRGMRTNLQFATVGRDVHSFSITSTQQQDGKTTTIANLAVVLAQGGQRVILVDADLRRPRIHKFFNGISNRVGLSSLMLADSPLDGYLQETEIPDLHILTAGPLPPNPPDVLNSPRMQAILALLEAEADIVLIDTPPLVVSDPLIIAGLVDAVAVVVVAGRTRNRDLRHTMQTLARTETPLLGVIINKIDLSNEGYSSYYQSYYAEHSGADGDDPPAAGTARTKGRHPFRLRRRLARSS